VATLVVAEGSRLLVQAPARFHQAVLAAAAVTAGTAAALVGFWRLLPIRTGEAIIGENWRASRGLLLAAGAFAVCTALTLSCSAGLRALRRPGAAFRARLIVAPLTAIGGMTGGLFFGAAWAMTGVAAAEAACAFLTLRAFRVAWASWRADPWSVEALPLGLESPPILDA
jgi:hypothetical protein